MLNKYENCSLTNESTCRSQLKCGAKYWINKFEHCGIRTKANYLYNDFKDLTQMCCGKCHSVVKAKLNVSFVLVICKMLLIWSQPLTHHQTTNFRLFKTERVCRRQFQI